MTDVCVIIVNWDTAALLGDCLAALEAALVRHRREVWVVDNGSTDGSVAMLRQRFPQVRVIENASNQGFARANNQVLCQATGRHLLLLNSDTAACPGSIDGLIDLMDSDSRIGIAGAQLLNADGSVQNSIAPLPTLLTELGNKSLLRLLAPQRYASRPIADEGPQEVESVVGACLLIRRATLEQIGLLDEDYFFFFEETDWCLRARAAGWKVVCDPRCRVYHFQGRSARRAPAEARIEYWRSRYRFFHKHRRRITNLVLAAGLVLKLGVDLSAAALASPFSDGAKQRRTVYFKIMRWHLAGRPADWGLAGRTTEPRRE